jgi:carbamoyl-phosphate synthase/aspartate carbamoyltransferase/dihydroorotase
LQDKARRAAAKAVCDVGLFAGATNDLQDAYLPAAAHACGLKIYVSDTFGSLRIDTLELMHQLFRTWAEKAHTVGYRTVDNPGGIGPVAVHAEELMLSVCLNLSHLYDVPLHVVHVSRRSEIELIAAAKERGYRVTCEATPHHLFLTTEDLARLGPLGDMRPRLATPDDQAALWEHLAYIDLFATDHAPHTLDEKAEQDPPPGVPGVETMLPLLLTAVAEGRLAVDDVVRRCVENPRRVYGLPAQPDTWVTVEVAERPTPWLVEEMRTRVGWSPFTGIPIRARVQEVVLRGACVYTEGELLAEPGSGRVLFGATEAAANLD